MEALLTFTQTLLSPCYVPDLVLSISHELCHFILTKLGEGDASVPISQRRNVQVEELALEPGVNLNSSHHLFLPPVPVPCWSLCQVGLRPCPLPPWAPAALGTAHQQGEQEWTLATRQLAEVSVAPWASSGSRHPTSAGRREARAWGAHLQSRATRTHEKMASFSAK